MPDVHRGARHLRLVVVAGEQLQDRLAHQSRDRSASSGRASRRTGRAADAATAAGASRLFIHSRPGVHIFPHRPSWEVLARGR
jgi:hypothetical protein